MKIQCEFCPRIIDARGMEAHVHFKHLREYLERFRQNPEVKHFMAYTAIRYGLLLCERNP